MQVWAVVSRACASLKELAWHVANISRIRGRSAAWATLVPRAPWLSGRTLGSSPLSGLSFVVLVFALRTQLALPRLEINAETTCDAVSLGERR